MKSKINHHRSFGRNVSHRDDEEHGEEEEVVSVDKNDDDEDVKMSKNSDTRV